VPENPTPAPGSGDGQTKRSRSAQNKIIEAYPTDSKKFLLVASTDAEIRPILEAHGYDAAEFTEGKQPRRSRQRRLHRARHRHGQTEAHRRGHGRRAQNRAARLRRLSRNRPRLFPQGRRPHQPQLKGDVPDDTGRFITLAETSYTAAGQDPWKTKLTKRGYPAPRLTTLKEELDDLTGTGGEQDEAEGDAIEDTSARDTAYEALKDFMKELKGTARGALRGKNGLLAKLGL